MLKKISTTFYLIIKIVQEFVRLFKLKEFRLQFSDCPTCGFSVFVKLSNQEIAIRCLRCAGTPVALSNVLELKKLQHNLENKRIYELSSMGPMVSYLKKNTSFLTLSEFYTDVKPGEYKNNIQCQNVENLTYPNESFDMCTSIDVFEHVANDEKGFAEIYRVLKPGGFFLFSVPLFDNDKTILRAKEENNQTIHLLEPEYHGDRIRGFQGVLCYRNYGKDIIETLENIGYSKIVITKKDPQLWWGFARKIIIAYK